MYTKDNLTPKIYHLQKNSQKPLKQIFFLSIKSLSKPNPKIPISFSSPNKLNFIRPKPYSININLLPLFSPPKNKTLYIK
jgi:hypothetical protein